jgi:hypothetical protein
MQYVESKIISLVSVEAEVVAHNKVKNQQKVETNYNQLENLKIIPVVAAIVKPQSIVIQSRTSKNTHAQTSLAMNGQHVKIYDN